MHKASLKLGLLLRELTKNEHEVRHRWRWKKRMWCWLRSELIPYSKDVWYVHCTCIASCSQVGFVSTALHSSSSCCVCTCLSEFCIWIEHWKIISWFEVFLISFNVTSQCFVEKNDVFSCQMTLVLFSIFVTFFSVLLYLSRNTLHW